MDGKNIALVIVVLVRMMVMSSVASGCLLTADARGMRLVVCLKWPITRGKHIMRSPLCYMSARNPSNTDPCLTPSTSTIPYLHFTGMSVPCSLTARPWSNDAFQQLQRHAQQSASVVMACSWT
jgi:hypothetical protein